MNDNRNTPHRNGRDAPQSRSARALDSALRVDDEDLDDDEDEFEDDDDGEDDEDEDEDVPETWQV